MQPGSASAAWPCLHRLCQGCLHLRPPHTPWPHAPPKVQLCSLTTPCYYSAGALLALVAAYFALFFLASNLIVPGGLFM